MRSQAQGASTASHCLNTSTKLRAHSDRRGRQVTRAQTGGAWICTSLDQYAVLQSVSAARRAKDDVTGGAVQKRGQGGTAARAQVWMVEVWGNGRVRVRRRVRERVKKLSRWVLRAGAWWGHDRSTSRRGPAAFLPPAMPRGALADYLRVASTGHLLVQLPRVALHHGNFTAQHAVCAHPRRPTTLRCHTATADGRLRTRIHVRNWRPLRPGQQQQQQERRRDEP